MVKVIKNKKGPCMEGVSSKDAIVILNNLVNQILNYKSRKKGGYITLNRKQTLDGLDVYSLCIESYRYYTNHNISKSQFLKLLNVLDTQNIFRIIDTSEEDGYCDIAFNESVYMELAPLIKQAI